MFGAIFTQKLLEISIYKLCSIVDLSVFNGIGEQRVTDSYRFGELYHKISAVVIHHEKHVVP